MLYTSVWMWNPWLWSVCHLTNLFSVFHFSKKLMKLWSHNLQQVNCTKSNDVPLFMCVSLKLCVCCLVPCQCVCPGYCRLCTSMCLLSIFYLLASNKKWQKSPPSFISRNYFQGPIFTLLLVTRNQLKSSWFSRLDSVSKHQNVKKKNEI